MATNADDPVPETPGTNEAQTNDQTQAQSDHEAPSLANPGDRQAAMDATIEGWIDRLATAAEEAREHDCDSLEEFYEAHGLL